VIAALTSALLAVAALPSAQSSSSAPEPPVYSLVGARLVWFHALSELDCVRLPPAMELVCSQYSSIRLDHAFSLAGPSIAAEIYPATEVRPHADFDQPILLVMLRDSAGQLDRVVAAAAADRAGRACISGADLDRLRWRPAGPEVQRAENGGICADLSRLQGLRSSAIPVVQEFGGRPSS
jgi:hypothetical protein